MCPGPQQKWRSVPLTSLHKVHVITSRHRGTQKIEIIVVMIKTTTQQNRVADSLASEVKVGAN